MQPEKLTLKSQEVLLEGEFKPGDKIKVGANDGQLVFQRK